MSVTNVTNKVKAIGNGAQLAFTFAFKIFSKTDLEVYKITTASGVATLQTLDVDYTVVINTVTEGGTVTYAVAPTALEQSFIKRVLPLTQTTVLPTESNFPEKAVENELDRCKMVPIQLEEEISRCIKQDITGDGDLELPTADPGKYLGWNDAGTAIVNKTTPTATDYPGSFTSGADAAKAAVPAVGDLYFATDTNRLYRCIGAGTWTYSAAYNLATIQALLLPDQGASPSIPANQLGIYSKAVNGISAPFYRGESDGSQFQLMPLHYRREMLCYQATATTLTVSPGVVDVGGVQVITPVTTTLTLTTAGNWAGGVSLQAVSTQAYIGIDTAGNIKLHTTAPSHDNFALSTTAGVKRYASWSGTVYRIIGVAYMNSTGAGEVTQHGVSNLRDGDVPNGAVLSVATDITTNSAVFVDMTSTIIHGYTIGRPVFIFLHAPLYGDTAGQLVALQIDIDGTGYALDHTQVLDSDAAAANKGQIGTGRVLVGLTQGPHVFTARWKTSAGIAQQNGATEYQRQISFFEL